MAIANCFRWSFRETAAPDRRFGTVIRNPGDLGTAGGSHDFTLMLTRLFALVKEGVALRIRRFEPRHFVNLVDWIYASLADVPTGRQSCLYVASGDFSPRFWNSTRHLSFGRLLHRPDRFPNFEMYGLASTYIAMSCHNVDIDSPATVTLDGRLFGNNMFSIFYKAFMRRDGRFNLLRSRRIRPCHWVACGGRMVIGDFPPACSARRCCCRPSLSVLVEGNEDAIREIARAEFHNAALSEADSSFIFQQVLENMPDDAQFEYLANNVIVPNHGFGVNGLDPLRRELEPVVHFGATLYRAGDFLLGTCENIRRAIKNESWFDEQFLDDGEDVKLCLQRL